MFWGQDQYLSLGLLLLKQMILNNNYNYNDMFLNIFMLSIHEQIIAVLTWRCGSKVIMKMLIYQLKFI